MYSWKLVAELCTLCKSSIGFGCNAWFAAGFPHRLLLWLWYYLPNIELSRCHCPLSFHLGAFYTLKTKVFYRQCKRGSWFQTSQNNSSNVAWLMNVQWRFFFFVVVLCSMHLMWCVINEESTFDKEPVWGYNGRYPQILLSLIYCEDTVNIFQMHGQGLTIWLCSFISF